MSQSPANYQHWLLKAEPESRIEKGIDVKFSIDDFESCKITSWEGVRNHQAKNFLKDKMKLGHKCLFYASNCKTPGIAGLCTVVKEGYPDHNAWDEKHPYYDPKSNPESPTWYMVDVEFKSRLRRYVPLALLQHLAQLASPPSCLSTNLTQSHLEAIARSALISRGRLSVQPVDNEFYEAVTILGDGACDWEEWWEEEKKGAKGVKGAKKQHPQNAEKLSKRESEKSNAIDDGGKVKVDEEDLEETVKESKVKTPPARQSRASKRDRQDSSVHPTDESNGEPKGKARSGKTAGRKGKPKADDGIEEGEDKPHSVPPVNKRPRRSIK